MTLQKHLEALAAQRRSIDEMDTSIRVAIQEIETALRGVVSTRIEARVTTGVLAFGKHGGSWRLMLHSDGDVEPVPLASKPRESRAAVFSEGMLEQLLYAAAVQLEVQCDQRRRALAETARSLQAIAAAGGK